MMTEAYQDCLKMPQSLSMDKMARNHEKMQEEIGENLAVLFSGAFCL